MTGSVTLDDEVLQLLAQPLFARLSTNGRDGYPHTVPIWFDTEPAADGTTTLWFISDRASAKVRNALVDPRAAAVIGGDADDALGLLLRGTISVENDPEQVMTHRMIDRYEPGERNAALRELWRDNREQHRSGVTAD